MMVFASVIAPRRIIASASSTGTRTSSRNSSGSVQASCLDCRAYLPAVPRPGAAEAKGFFATLALLLK